MRGVFNGFDLDFGDLGLEFEKAVERVKVVLEFSVNLMEVFTEEEVDWLGEFELFIINVLLERHSVKINRYYFFDVRRVSGKIENRKSPG